MPSLLEAYKLSSRAAQAGFDWPNVEGLFDKLNEETNELREQLEAISGARTASAGSRHGRIRTNARP